MTDSMPSRPMHPGWCIPMAIVGGLAAAGPAAGSTLRRLGQRRLGWVLGPSLGVLGVLLLVFATLWAVEWYWAALLLFAVHLVCGTTLFFFLRGRYRRFVELSPPPHRERGSHREILAGAAGGFVLGGLLGTTSVVLYLLLMDWLFSTAVPVIFDDQYAWARVMSASFVLSLSGGVAGAFLGRLRPHASAGQVILYGCALMWAHLTWLAAVEAMIAVPGFQAGAATGQGWYALMAPLTLGNFLVGSWWPVFLVFFITAPPGRGEKLKRAALVVAMNLAAGAVLSISLGHTVDVLLALGRHLERRAYTLQALACYELGLKKHPDEGVASYLQYRAALLSHKLGDRERAERGLRRVVAKYTAHEELVKKANRFLDNLARGGGKRRVVLPGVETRTEYKSAYCAPNSLALTLSYWGVTFSARTIGRRITGLGSGTFAVNQKWFAEQESFRHEFLPLASLEDIKRSIDAGFPVMVYVPAHVFVVVGYDEALGTLVTYDVATQDVWVDYLQKDFVKSWKRQATTLVLAYPPDKERLLPEDIRARLHRLSDSYLHYQLHYFDAPPGSVSVPHLMRAAGETGELFLPVTILYSGFPGLREEISQRYDADQVADSIRTFFQSDFDEGTHLWGQYHDQQNSWPDMALKFSLEYLIGHGRFGLVRELTARIDDEGQLSDDALAEVGMVDLAQGHPREGLDRLERAGEGNRALYNGLALLKVGNVQAGIRQLVQAVGGGT